MLPGMPGAAPPPPDNPGGGVQNAPGIAIVNNSRSTTAWARKAWKEEMARKAKSEKHTWHKAKSFGLSIDMFSSK